MVYKTKVMPFKRQKGKKLFTVQKRKLGKKAQRNNLKIFVQSWRNFFSNCTIDGLNLIGGYSKLHVIPRVSLMAFFLVVCCVMFYLCGTCIQFYLTYTQKSYTHYNVQEEIDFPAIAFMNQNLYKRSSAGLNPFIMMLFTVDTFNTEINKDKLFYDLALNQRMCPANGSDVNFMDFHNKATNGDIADALALYMMSSKMCVKKCWWQNKEINCTGIFTNWVSDNLKGFAFNSPVDMLANVPQFKPKIVNRAGPLSGLQLLMNTDQEEYCGVADVPYGAGFKLMMYSPKFRQPSMIVYPAISLSPGYDYKISLKPVVYNRLDLEWLGNCTNSSDSILDKENIYDRSKCFLSCAAKMAFDSCQCLPNGIPSNSIAEKYLATSLTKVNRCVDPHINLTKMMCLRNLQVIYFSKNPAVVCPKCKTPCLETTYSYQISSAKLSLKIIKEIGGNRTLSLSQKESIQKNYLQVNFFFEDMIGINIFETLYMSKLDLFMYLSNTMGLFIGISVLTFSEILYQIVFSFQVLVCQSKPVWQTGTSH